MPHQRRGAADFADAGQEREHVAGQVFVVQNRVDRRRGGFGDPVARRRRPVQHLHRVGPTEARDRLGRAIMFLKKRNDRRRIERRGHHRDPQVVPHGLPQPGEQPQRGVHLQRPLVKFIQKHRGDRLGERIGLQPPQQDAGRHDDYSRLIATSPIKADVVADVRAERTASGLGQSIGRCPRGQLAGLDEPNLSAVDPRGIPNHRGHPGRLARPRRCSQHDGPAASHRRGDRVVMGLDRKRCHRSQRSGSRQDFRIRRIATESLGDFRYTVAAKQSVTNSSNRSPEKRSRGSPIS